MSAPLWLKSLDPIEVAKQSTIIKQRAEQWPILSDYHKRKGDDPYNSDITHANNFNASMEWEPFNPTNPF